MTQPTPEQTRSKFVNSIFSRIARHYDLMNRLMTGGQDMRWRRAAVHLLNPRPEQQILDLGCGTGDLAREVARQCSESRVAAGDFTLEMMMAGRQKGIVPFAVMDALSLPIGDESVDGVISGFLMRNVVDLPGALSEQFRVLRPGGRLVILETTQPQRNILSPLIWLHMHVVIPVLGGLISGVREAYRYLPDSSEKFLTAEEFSQQITARGFSDVKFKRYMFGTIAIHDAIKI